MIFDLQLFADGDAGGTGDSAQAAAVQGTETTENNVANESGTPAAPERIPFDELIKGEYKADYDARVQDIVKKRLKGSEETKKKLESLNPLLFALREKYGLTDQDDPQKILDAVLDDDDVWERQAMDQDMDVAAYKKLNRANLENKILREREQQRLNEIEQQRSEEAGQRAFNTILQEADALKSKYPSLDFSKEMSDPKFCEEVAFWQRRGDPKPFQRAYESRHFDEIMTHMAQTATQTSAKKVADAVAANKNRPAENGLAQGGIKSTFDPTKLTKQQRAEIRKRVARGEQICF